MRHRRSYFPKSSSQHTRRTRLSLRSHNKRRRRRGPRYRVRARAALDQSTGSPPGSWPMKRRERLSLLFPTGLNKASDRPSMRNIHLLSLSQPPPPPGFHADSTLNVHSMTVRKRMWHPGGGGCWRGGVPRF